MQKNITIIGVASDYGASITGSDKGADSIRESGLRASLETLKHKIEDLGNITPSLITPHATKAPPNNLKNLDIINDVNTKLFKAVTQALKNNSFPLTLGGDHSLSAGSVPAVQQHYGNIGVIWVDAHGDFNDAESSPSGNIHGMSFSAAVTGEPCQILPFLSAPIPLDPKNCVLFGARDLDKAEAVRLKKSGVTVIEMPEIQSNENAAIEKAVRIAGNTTNGIYLSFDLDSLDPSISPAVGTPVANGITESAALSLFDALKSSKKLLGAEFTELNPLKDKDNKTARLAVKLISTLFAPAKQKI